MQTAAILRRPSLKPNLEYATKRKRKQFGHWREFSNSLPVAIVDIASFSSDAQTQLVLDKLDSQCQFTPSISQREVNTDHRIGESTGINHVEGGWPKDVHYHDLEQTMRFKKKNEKDENFIQTITQLGKLVEHGLEQNNALNIFRKHFPKNKAKYSDSNVRLSSIFRDSNCEGSVSGLSWNSNKKLAVAYSQLFSNHPNTRFKSDAIIWDVVKCNIAEMSLSGPSAPVSVEFNNKDPNSIIGGCTAGQVVYWDVRRGSAAVETSEEGGHRSQVRSVVWLNSKTGTEFFSGSVDGQVCWWDIRKMNEPLDKLFVDPSKTGDPQLNNSLGVTVLEFEPTMSTKFMIGTEEGMVFVCNSKAKTMAEKLAGTYNAHLGPIRTLQRNPLIPKNFLTVGDWSAKIWSEDVRESSVINTGYQSRCTTGGCWNPVKPSVFFTITDDGFLEFWDVLVFHHRPIQQLKISDNPLSAIRVQESGRVLACGCSDGSVGLLDTSDDITALDKNEKSSLTTLFERETRREKILEARMREQKALQRCINLNADKTNCDDDWQIEAYKTSELEYEDEVGKPLV